jgi:hypothetical protein
MAYDQALDSTIRALDMLLRQHDQAPQSPIAATSMSPHTTDSTAAQ